MVEEVDEDEEEQEELAQLEEEEEERGVQLSIASIRELLSIMETLKDKILQFDDQPSRASTAVASLNSALKPYKDLFSLHMTSWQQALITRHFKPQHSPSTLIPQPIEEREIEEIILATEDDACSTLDGDDQHENASDSE